MFPGQGSLKAGAAESLSQKHPKAKALLEESQSILGFNPFEPNRLHLTAYAQPAILSYSIAALSLLEDKPDYLAGHSLGEYSALVAGGVLSFEEALKAVHFRGQVMQEAVSVGEGAMMVVLGEDPKKLGELCQEAQSYIAVANFNGPGQTVLSGTKAGIEEIKLQVKRSIPLAVSAPFHCALMQPAKEKLAEYFTRLDFKNSDIPIVSNVHAEPIVSGSDLKRLLIEQVTAPVQFTRMVECLRKLGVESWVEVGPGETLTNLIKRF